MTDFPPALSAYFFFLPPPAVAEKDQRLIQTIHELLPGTMAQQSADNRITPRELAIASNDIALIRVGLPLTAWLLAPCHSGLTSPSAIALLHHVLRFTRPLPFPQSFILLVSAHCFTMQALVSSTSVTPFPPNSIAAESQTGTMSRHTFNHALAKIGAARGGKEGNMALVAWHTVSLGVVATPGRGRRKGGRDSFYRTAFACSGCVSQ